MSVVVACWPRPAARPQALALLLLLATAVPAASQSFSQRGFLEGRLEFYPQEGSGDDRQAFADALFRQEASWQASGWFSLGGAFDARVDNAGRVERSWSVDWSDRGALRPALSVRRLSAVLQRGGLRVEAGKQLVRWGKADILNPTDRFAPRDFFEVVDSEYIPVTAGRLMWERGANTIDLVVSRFTPSRIPAAGSRWAPGPSLPIPVVDGGALFPSRAQVGARWSHVGRGFEYSAAFFDGHNHLPRVTARLDPAAGALVLARGYLPLRLYGADAAWPLRWLTLKGEIGYFTSSDESAGGYGIYVVQVERQTGEWFLVGGYAGEFVTREGLEPQFSPERGLAKTVLGRASYTIRREPQRGLRGRPAPDRQGRLPGSRVLAGLGPAPAPHGDGHADPREPRRLLRPVPREFERSGGRAVQLLTQEPGVLPRRARLQVSGMLPGA